MKMSEVKYLFLWGVRKAKVTILCTLYFFKITISNFISKKKNDHGQNGKIEPVGQKVAFPGEKRVPRYSPLMWVDPRWGGKGGQHRCLRGAREPTVRS